MAFRHNEPSNPDKRYASTCQVYREGLADDSGLSLSAVARGIRSLKDLGIIKTAQRPNAKFLITFRWDYDPKGFKEWIRDCH